LTFSASSAAMDGMVEGWSPSIDELGELVAALQ
jgi:hypothetical protein